MSYTLLNILDEVMLLSGVDTETEYVANSSDAVKRLVSIANQSAVSLAVYPWQNLRSQYSFVLDANTDYPLPDDYRAIIPDTMYINGQLWPVDFPAETGYWSYLRSSSGGEGPRYQIRLLGNRMHVYNPTSGDTVEFEYLSNYPVLNSSAVAQQRFTADADTWRLDDDLIVRDVLWRYKKLMGEPDWQIDLADFKSYENTLKGHDKSAQILMPKTSPPNVPFPYFDTWV